MDTPKDPIEMFLPLSEAQMHPERDEEIRRHISQVVRSESLGNSVHRRSKGWLGSVAAVCAACRTLGWIGSASAALAVAVFAIGVILVNHGQFGQPMGRTSASQKGVSSVTLHYTSSQLAQVKSAAQTAGVTPWIPKYGLSGDELIGVKDGEPGTLILVYKNFWLIEQTSSPTTPRGVITQQSVTIGRTPGLYMIVQATAQQQSQRFSYLSFKRGVTHITMENLTGGHPTPISVKSSVAIASSFEQVP